MKVSVRTRIQQANAMLAGALSHLRETLNGHQDFNVEIIQALARPLQEVAPALAQASELRASDPGLAADLQQYADTLSALHGVLDQVRFMLLARQTSLQASLSHLETMNLWATTLNLTR